MANFLLDYPSNKSSPVNVCQLKITVNKTDCFLSAQSTLLRSRTETNDLYHEPCFIGITPTQYKNGIDRSFENGKMANSTAEPQTE